MACTAVNKIKRKQCDIFNIKKTFCLKKKLLNKYLEAILQLLTSSDNLQLLTSSDIIQLLTSSDILKLLTSNDSLQLLTSNYILQHCCITCSKSANDVSFFLTSTTKEGELEVYFRLQMYHAVNKCNVTTRELALSA